MVRVHCLIAVLACLLAAPALSAAAERTRAGVATVDATWHVGASAGQFTDDTGPTGGETIDPHAHSTKKRRSDGVGVTTTTRALVIRDTQGDRVAIVANDLYLSQDFLNRRVAGLLAEHDRKVTLGLEEGPITGITADNMAITSSHNHMTPFYSTPGWGTAVFQDVIDLRFYDYMAQQMAKAVIEASSKLVPVRMGGSTRAFDAIQGHTYGPKVGDDGTPAGQPFSHTAAKVSVVRFDDMTDPRKPKPLANWVIFGVHPEFTTWGPDLISGDITQAAARMLDRELGTTSVFSQRETGASGPHKDTRVHQPEERREFEDNGFGQLDRASRLLADAVKDTLDDIERGKPESDNAYAAWAEDFDVASVSQRFAPPATRPYPGASNCNTASLFHGDPRLPVLGLPDCYGTNQHGTGAITEPLTPTTSELYNQLKDAGVPVPESISATKLTAVEETNAVHMMAIRLGDIVATICPCEQFTDTALNIESRLDKVAGNIWKGFDWAAHKTPAGRSWCVPGEGGTWTCADPRNPSVDLAPISDRTYRRFRAQINNDATGWETDLATLGSEAEPADPDKIKGNFTHEEFPDRGYGLVLAVGMANDYWGYMPEYREYRSHDHYRKALNGLGPHGADFLATRLGRMGASLNGGEPVAPSALDLAFTAEQGRAEATAQALGELGRAYNAAYDASLPADGGAPAITEQPSDIERFAAAHLRFVGGSNFTDRPEVRVERRQGKRWAPFGDMTGEVQLMVDFPAAEQLADYRAGTFTWMWTAAFEAFSSDISQHDASGHKRRQTPSGIYRFVVDGRHRDSLGAAPAAYRLESKPFAVRPWSGITAEDLRVENDGRVSFTPGPVSRHSFGENGPYAVGPIDYPDSYTSPFRYIDGKRVLFTYGLADPTRHQQYCPRCSFRPWADTGNLEKAEIRVRATDGTERTLAAEPGADGRWRSAEPIAAGETAWVPAGGLRDEHDETNGAPSAEVTA